MRNKTSYSRFIQSVNTWEGLEKGRMIQLLHHCVEHDITSFDDSDFLGTKHINKTFGTALSESGLSRDEIQIISKYGEAGTGKNLIESIDNLLLTLKTDYLDLLLLDFNTTNEEQGKSVEQLIAQGKVLITGSLRLQDSFRNHTSLPITAGQLKSPFNSAEDYKAVNSEHAALKEVSAFVWHDFGSTSSELESALEELSRKNNCTPQQLALMWILAHPAQLHPVLSLSEKEEISEAAASKDKQMDPVDWQQINLLLS